MRDNGDPLHFNLSPLDANAQRAGAARTQADYTVSDRPFFPVAGWRILDQARQVAEISRTHAFARRLCTELSTDFLDNPIDIEARGEKRAMRCGGGYT